MHVAPLVVEIDGEVPHCDLFDNFNKTSELNSAKVDELPAGAYYDRRGRLIRLPKRYLS